MKELFQVIDIEKWARKVVASTIIVSMVMIDVAKAMDDDPHLSKVVQRASQKANPQGKSKLSEKTPLLGSAKSSYFRESSSDSDKEVEIDGSGHPQSHEPSSTGGFRGALEIEKFASTQPSTTGQPVTSHSSRYQSTPNVILRDNKIIVNGGNAFILGQGHTSIQSQDSGDDEASIQSQDPEYVELSVNAEIEVVTDNGSTGPALTQLDEHIRPASQSRFLPAWLSEWLSDRPFWPEKPTYRLSNGGEAEDLRKVELAKTYFLASLPRQAHEDHAVPLRDSDSEGDGSAVHLLPSSHSHGDVRDDASFADTSHPLPPQTPWLQFLDGLDGETKTHLINFTNKVINGETSWAGFIGKWLVGPAIGLGFAYGIGPVYDGGIDYLANQVPAFNTFISGNAGRIFIWYITASAFEGIFRNSTTYGHGFDYFFSSEKKEGGRMCIAGAIAALTAFIPVAYLILAENVGREILQLPNWDNEFGVAVATWGPFLYFDALGTAYKTAWESVPKIKNWFWQAWEVFCPSSLPPQMKSPEETLRENFDYKLLKLKQFLVGASDALIEKIDHDIQAIHSGLHKDKQAAGILAYLLASGDQVQKVTVKNSKKSPSEISFKALEYATLILEAPTIGLLLQLVGSTVASLFTSNTVADSIGEGFALIAFLPFSYVLDQFMGNFKNLLSGEDPQGYESHPMARLPVKVFIGIQSLLYLFQTSIAVLQSYQKWFGDGWWPFAAATPFFIPKFMELVCNFNGSFNEQITTSVINFSHWIGGGFRGAKGSPCLPCRKGKLIRDIEKYRKGLGGWAPNSIQQLPQAIEFFKHNGENISFEAP